MSKRTATPVLVDTIPLLEACIKDVTAPENTKLAVDLEGVDLCRNGRVSIIQLFAKNSDIIWLVDVTVLGRLAFEHKDASTNDCSLKDVLESTNIVKLLYDVRNDADALYNLYQVDMKNTYDLQLLEVASRRALRLRVKFICGLAKAMTTYLSPPSSVTQIKEDGVALFRPEKGGSFEVFERRPLDPRIILYCAQDVAVLFQLEAVLENTIRGSLEGWHDRVVKASAKRVNEAHSRYYDGDGPHRAIAPMI
ncbi:hypothetical protein D9613_009781 [Agrocybe pediades]|uniref:3'-5' exonuclease domain-containing protein n=1 Tax=Agrocybe pediades TaxID=84607 RepID=A0A8H4QVX2_9AGAR|nr:hypothetical protein D9613_009781 [Agrocybe pediades]